MTFNKQIIAITLGLLVSFFVASTLWEQVVSAQVVNTAGSASMQSSCIIFNNNMGYGANDYSTSGAVSALQNFLITQGNFSSIYLGTGHYGSITLRAVAQFQAAHGVPATGFVGPLTRGVIEQITCGTNPTPTPVPTSSVSLYNESPSSGAIGTTVTLTGFGFTQDNTVLMGGLVAARNVPITSSIAIACTTNPSCHGGINQSITFTIPSSLSPNCPVGSMCPMFLRAVTPGQYDITVLNTNGTSNTLTFTVTSGTTNNQQLSISGLSAPASLALGQSGIWSVQALSNGAGNLHYSVVWGDEGTVTNGIMAPQNTSVQSSATFTHAYQHSGNYTPVFTVTDDFGHSVSASNTVVITPLY